MAPAYVGNKYETAVYLGIDNKGSLGEQKIPDPRI